MNELQVEALVLKVLLQVMVIIVAARAAGLLFRRIGQPRVCGEIAAGIILGPSLFGALFPELFSRVFDPVTAPTFLVLSQLGLILLLFLIGLEFDFGQLRGSAHAPVAISAAGIALPFAAGFAFAHVLHPAIGVEADPLGFALFMGLTFSITALPILGRIMIEFGLNRTRIGAITITSAAIDDTVAWIILVGVIAIVRTSLDPVAILSVAGQTLAFTAVMFFAVRPLLRRWADRTLGRTGGPLPAGALAVVLLVVFAAAAATSAIGVFAIFGAFIAGAILHDHEALRNALRSRLDDFVAVFFLPIFFTYTGLRTTIGALQEGNLWILCALLVALACVSKLGGCTLAARAAGLSWRHAWGVGVMMNTRALMALVVINVGYDLGILPPAVFTMLVIMALVTTFKTAPLLRRALPDLIGSAGGRPAPARVPAPRVAVAAVGAGGEARVREEARVPEPVG